MVDGQDGRPVLQLTNPSGLALTAYVWVLSPYEGGEDRHYHDSCIFTRDQPIPKGHSITRLAGYDINAEFKTLRAEAPAVVFEDGSTDGDPSWIDALLARRLRFYDRLMGLHDLLKQQIGTGASRQAVIDKLQSAQASADQQLPNDDLRKMDDLAFLRAISTMQANLANNLDDLLKQYLKFLEDETSQLSRCQPALETIRRRLAERPNPEQPIVPPRFAH